MCGKMPSPKHAKTFLMSYNFQYISRTESPLLYWSTEALEDKTWWKEMNLFVVIARADENIVNLSLLPCSLTNYKDKKRARKYAHIDLGGRQVIFFPWEISSFSGSKCTEWPILNPTLTPVVAIAIYIWFTILCTNAILLHVMCCKLPCHTIVSFLVVVLLSYLTHRGKK